MNRRVDRKETKTSPKKASATKHASNKLVKRPSSRQSARHENSDTVSSSMRESFSRTKVSEHLPSLEVSAWMDHHRSSCVDSLRRMFELLGQSLMTWLVVAIALVLPAMLYLGLSNVQQLGQGWQSNTQLSAYIRLEAKPLAVDQLHERLVSSGDFQSVELITPEQAKQDFLRYSGLGDVLLSLENNPLPAVLLITPIAERSTVEALEGFRALLVTEPLVESVQFDAAWLNRLNEMIDLVQRLVIALAVLLGIGALLVIINTLRLAIESRRNEIVVVKMVGATDGFVQRPFLYTGFWYGIGGGILALLILIVAGFWLSEPVSNLIKLYGSEHPLTWLNFGFSSLLLCVSGVLGWLGAWLAVSRHVKAIEPT